MGKAIVYCQICGQSLYEDDFERGKASRIDNRPYCAACKKPAAAPSPPTPSPRPAPPPATRRAATDRVPVLRPPSTARLPKAAPRRNPAVALWGSLLFVGVALAIGLTLALAGRKPPELPEPVKITEPVPLPPRPGPPVDKDVDLLRRLLAAPPAEWKREEIDAALARRPELAAPRKEYERGLLGLGLLDGLVAHWPLDEKDGGVARDATGRGHDGKVIGAPPRGPGKLGGAFQFRGNDEDGVEIPATNELDTLEAKSYSVSLWFQPERIPAGKDLQSNDSWYGLFIRPGLHVGLCYSRQGVAEYSLWLDGQKQGGHVSTEPIPPGAWSHVVGVVDVVAGRTRIFVNGRASGETPWPPGTRAHRHSGPWRIGIAAPKATGWSWSTRGFIDDVRFYARALAADEIALLAEGVALPSAPAPGRAPSNDGLVLHLKSDVGVGAVNGVVNTWTDVERKLVTHAEDDERPAWKDGAIVLDGKNDRVAFQGLPEHLFKIGDSFTLRATVRLDTIVKGRWSGVFAKSIEKAPWYGIWIDYDGRWVFGSTSNLHGSLAKTGTTTVTALQIGGRERRLYVDGVRVATGPAMDASGTGDLWIGGVKGRGEYLNGALLEIKLWRRALEPAEVLIK